jgi:hypothetical protein
MAYAVPKARHLASDRMAALMGGNKMETEPAERVSAEGSGVTQFC